MMRPRAALPTAWHGRVRDFLSAEAEAIVSALHARYAAGPEQIRAWLDSLRAVASALRRTVEARPDAREWWVALEYELPREGGRRPDICIVTSNEVLVIEAKASSYPPPEGIEQCRAYVRDLREYHAACHGLRVRGALLATGWVSRQSRGDVELCGPFELTSVLRELDGGGPSQAIIDEWLSAPYLPLPSLVQAARLLFEREPLPELRRVRSAGVEDAVHSLRAIVRRATETKTHHLVLVSGSPGAGKTLVGLQLVHEHRDDLGDKASAVFLSGNAPLVEVLQYVLGNKVFVRDVHRFMFEHGVRQLRPPPEDVLVFDEAQRAWDGEKVKEWYLTKRQINHDLSEPTTFVQIVGSRTQGGVLVGLIGYGQEIHTGEEGGIRQWAHAVRASGQPWTIHCAGRFREFFRDLTVEEHAVLDLTTSLRSHAAETLHIWVEHLLEGRLAHAAEHSKELRLAGFPLYITSDLDQAKAFVLARYSNEYTKTFGLIASSKSRNLAAYGVDTGFGSRVVLKPGRVGPWFHGKNGLPPHCREIATVATEFQCQGLELDGGVLLWGSDFVWADSSWRTPVATRARAKDPAQLRKNSYRVLLTRFRDGLVVYCPPGEEMRGTYNALLKAGFVALPS